MNLQDATDHLIGSALSAAQKHSALDAHPSDVLMHFTDAGGLAGILRTKALWATRASCMNDASELKYTNCLGRSILAARLAADQDSRFSSIWEIALKVFDGSSDLPQKANLYIDAFVASFCARADSSVHWLHYGRGGRGYALGIDFSAADLEGWSLVPVVYREDEQRRVLQDLYNRIQEDVAELVDRQPAWEEMDLAKITFSAGFLMAHVTGFVAPCFKHPCFEAEGEWRLFRTWIEGQFTGQTGTFPLNFRTSGSLVVPYTDFCLKPEYIRKVVMGYQVPDDPTRESVRFLLQSHGIDLSRCAIENSNIPVRGAA